jgi:hypothetical protein
MAERTTVTVTGLREFSKSLRRLDSEAVKGLRIVMNEAVQIVIDDARPKIPVRTGAAVGTLKARSTRTAAKLQMGGDKAPYMPWLDFGGRVGKNKSVSRPFYKEGRYVYVSLRERRPDIEKAMQDGIVRVARAAGLEVS